MLPILHSQNVFNGILMAFGNRLCLWAACWCPLRMGNHLPQPPPFTATALIKRVSLQNWFLECHTASRLCQLILVCPLEKKTD